MSEPVTLADAVKYAAEWEMFEDEFASLVLTASAPQLAQIVLRAIRSSIVLNRHLQAAIEHTRQQAELINASKPLISEALAIIEMRDAGLATPNVALPPRADAPGSASPILTVAWKGPSSAFAENRAAIVHAIAEEVRAIVESE